MANRTADRMIRVYSASSVAESPGGLVRSAGSAVEQTMLTFLKAHGGAGRYIRAAADTIRSVGGFA